MAVSRWLAPTFAGAFALLVISLGVRFIADTIQGALIYQPPAVGTGSHYTGKALERALKSRKYRVDQLEYSVTPKGFLDLSVFSGKQQAHKALLARPPGKTFEGDVWVFFGGNAMLASDWTDFCARVAALQQAQQPQAAFLLFNYPGFGGNEGHPAPWSVLEASLEALDAALAALGSPSDAPSLPAIHFLGHSIGAAAAAQLAAHLSGDRPLSPRRSAPVKPGRLVLSAPFLHIEKMAQVLLLGKDFPTRLIRPFISHRWDNTVSVPAAVRGGWDVSIVHPKNDEMVPVSHGRRVRKLAEAAGGGANLTMVEPHSVGHNDVLSREVPLYAKLMGFTSTLHKSKKPR